MTSSIGSVAPRLQLVAADGTTTTEAVATPTAEETAIATEYPAGAVQLENNAGKKWLQIPGAAVALGGAAVLVAALLTRKAPAGIESHLRLGQLAIGGGMVAAGAAATLGASLLPPKTRIAIATNIPTEAKAREIALTFKDRQTKVVQDIHGKFAVLDEGPSKTSSSGGYYNGGRGHYYGDGHFHGSHYYGDGHNHGAGYYDPYYPGTGGSYRDPYYPTPSGGYTSPGDDYGSGGYTPSYPSGGSTSSGDDYDSGYSGGSTSSGDDYDSGSSYTPPSYDYGSSYDDSPSYSSPSYDYGSSYDSGSSSSWDSGSSYSYDSSSNGNPSYDDF